MTFTVEQKTNEKEEYSPISIVEAEDEEEAAEKIKIYYGLTETYIFRVNRLKINDKGIYEKDYCFREKKYEF